MIKKIVFFIVAISLAFPSVVNGEYKINRNYLKLSIVNPNEMESIEIKNTDLTNKDNAKKLVTEIDNKENYNIELSYLISYQPILLNIDHLSPS